MALFSALAWLAHDLIVSRMSDALILARIHSAGLQYWSGVVRLGFFVIVAVLTNLILRLRRLNESERQVSELKSNLVALVSHEFGNLLTTFRLGLTLLRESEESEPSPDKQQHYAMLDRVYTHLSSAVANFLNLNRIESGRFVPHMGKISLRAQIHGAIALQGAILASKRLALSTAMPPGPLLAFADTDALAVVLNNLIGNSFKYTPDGGSVTVRVELVPPQAALVIVEDTGIGIPAEELPLIASGYYRAKRGRRAAKGHGVGLQVVKDLLESQHSRLEIDSEPGKGSRFSFRLPLWREPLR
jgi:signal transduction histidine kinase